MFENTLPRREILEHDGASGGEAASAQAVGQAIVDTAMMRVEQSLGTQTPENSWKMQAKEEILIGGIAVACALLGATAGGHIAPEIVVGSAGAGTIAHGIARLI